MLLGQQLQKAGLAFMSAKARHSRGGVRIDEIVCETVEDAQRVDEWAAREGFPVEARVASVQEVAEWKKWQE
jgi:hypothetical protein